jgi:hypothetical protein
MANADPTALSAIFALMFPPLFVGAVGLVWGLRRSAPGKWLFGIPAVWCTLLGLGMTLVIALLLAIEKTSRHEPFVWVGLVLTLVALVRVVRSFFRTGWERFTYLIGAIWLVGVVIAVAMNFSPKPFFTHPTWGDWAFLVGLSALAPLVAFAAVRRKA